MSMIRRRPEWVHSLLRWTPRCVTSALATSALGIALATTHGHELTRVSAQSAPIEDELKRVYLSCSCQAIHQTLGREGVMACSVVYEELKETVFDGDFDRLLEWSRSQPLSLCAHTASKPPLQ
jgi:hypothetical protein